MSSSFVVPLLVLADYHVDRVFLPDGAFTLISSPRPISRPVRPNPKEFVFENEWVGVITELRHDCDVIYAVGEATRKVAISLDEREMCLTPSCIGMLYTFNTIGQKLIRKAYVREATVMRPHYFPWSGFYDL